MVNCRGRGPRVYFLLWFLMAFDPCASLNREGVALLRFKEMIEADPSHALLDWVEGNASPCSWFGVECSDDGVVMGLNLANLGLKGTLPPQIGELTHMHSLVLHKNSFYGTIPTEIGNLLELKVLNLGYNNFNGTIPAGLRNILSIEFIFLEGNQLSDGLPIKLNKLTSLSKPQVHRDWTLSNKASTARSKRNTTIRRLLARKEKHSQKNQMLGSETTVLEPSDKTFLLTVPSPAPTGNAATPLLPPRHRLLPPPPPDPVPSPAPAVSPSTNQTTIQEEGKSKNISSSIIYGSIGGAICFVVIALSVAIFLCYRSQKTSIIVPLSPTAGRHLRTPTLAGITSFRRSALENACEDFSNVIGTLPGFILYKGTLPMGAEIGVVCTLINHASGWSTIAEAEFENKVEVLSQVNHKNFMKLLGYCEDEEPFTRMMVFEYVSNGSLFEHLHVQEAEHLNWQSRLRIAMGVMYCMSQMHQQNPPIILRNLNSSCIYLTEDNAAKVSDISFSGDKKEGGDEFYGSTECRTVYQFALLLLEMISGRRPFSEDKGLLILWAHRYLTGEKPFMGMVDPTLQSVPEEHIRALTELVKLCISDDPRLTPTVAEVTKRMQEITGISQDQAIPRNRPLWWAELEILTT